MKTTIPKLRRTLRKVIKEMAYDSDRDQEHLAGLKDWITQATEDGMEEDYDTTRDSYYEACMDDGDTISVQQVEAYLDELLANDGDIDEYGDMIINVDLYEAMEEDEDEDY